MIFIWYHTCEKKKTGSREEGVKYMFSRQNFVQPVEELWRKTDRGTQLSVEP